MRRQLVVSVVSAVPAAFLLAWVAVPLAAAQTPVVKTDIDKAAEINPGDGLFVIDATVDGTPCSETKVGIGRVVNGSHRLLALVEATSGSIIKTLTKPQPARPGELFVMEVWCKSGNLVARHRGLYAKFTLRAGEVVNVGRVDIEIDQDSFHGKTGTRKTALHPLSSDVLAELRQLYPTTLARMVDRPMRLIGPAETRTRNSPSGSSYP